jgi:GNAT superfamily N-acetyltransferase
MKPRLREAGPEDAALLRELMLACWTGMVAADSSAFRETEADLRAELAKGGAILLSQGHLSIGSVRWRNLGDAWEMARLGVLPAFRRLGHSQTLTEAVAMRARNAGARELRIGIRRDQPRLLDFYATQGFVLADDFAYSHPNPLTEPPWLMRRVL